VAEAVLYCAEEELLLGGVPVKKDVDANKYIRDATDEIDSALGSRYDTPFDLSDESELKRHSKLLIQRICRHLASGRIILALAMPGEDGRVNAYGMSLLTEALAALEALGTGVILLDYEDTSPVAPLLMPSVPMIFNQDPESSVEAFYDRVGNPNYQYPERELLVGRRRSDRDPDQGQDRIL
jgi:hypothetical protein